EYLKDTALYFAASLSAPLKVYNFETILDTLDLCKEIEILCKRVKVPRTFKMTMDFSELWHGLTSEWRVFTKRDISKC
ncbi:hypothetical protein NQ317_017915, partial [Molorchus minor]